MNTRFNRNKLNIGTYILQPYARSEKHIKDLRDCGIEFVIDIDYDKDALDLFYKYGIGAFVRGVVPGWWGGDGSNAGTLKKRNPLDLYTKCSLRYEDHPAVWAISIGDEPSALDFPCFGVVYDHVNKLFPTAFPYLNLYPNYASVCENTADETVNQLGTETYEQHIEEYCKYVPADYISYDHYVYAPMNLGKCLENFRIVANAARNYGKRFMYVCQVNSQRPGEWMSVNNLRFQAFSAMSYGAEDITWACYTGGWWHNNVLDENGEKTEQYDKLKLVNSEIRNLADIYMQYRNTNAHLLGFTEEVSKDVNQKVLESLNVGYFTELKAENNEPLIIGEMSSRYGKDEKALFITASDDWKDKACKTYNITFKSLKSITIFGKDGKVPFIYDKETETYSVEITSSEALMIIAK